MRKKSIPVVAVSLLALGMPLAPAAACGGCSMIPFEHCVLGTTSGWDECTQPETGCHLVGENCGGNAFLFTLDGSIRYARNTEPSSQRSSERGLVVDGSYVRRACDQAIVERSFNVAEVQEIWRQTSNIAL